MIDDSVIMNTKVKDDPIAKIIYNEIFHNVQPDIYREWEKTLYQAPEQREGFVTRKCCYLANLIRETIKQEPPF